MLPHDPFGHAWPAPAADGRYGDVVHAPEPLPARPEPAAPGRWRRWRSDVLLAVAVALVVAPVFQPLMAQQASRYALTAALWDGRTVVLDDYAHLLSVDRAERGGRLYSDKAPGQPALAVPAYAAYRLFGGPPATAARWYADPGLWIVSLWSAALPAAVLAVLMRRLALRAAPRGATVAALALAFGTMLLPFATVLFSHVLAGALGLGAYLLVSRPRPGRGALAAAGLVAGLAVTVEYTMAFVALLVAAVALARHGRRVGWLVAAAVPAGAALAAYHWVAFGGPLTTGYRFSGFAEQHSRGIVGVRPPEPALLAEVLLGERGLFVLTPVVLVGVVGAVLLLRARGQARTDAAVALGVLAFFLVVMGGWGNATGGASPGPRYAVPALPFLASGVAVAWQRSPWLTGAAAAVGAATMGLATFTLPLAQPSEPSALAWWAGRLADGQVADTLLTGVAGPLGIVPPLVAAAAVVVVLVRGDPARRPARDAAPAAA